MFIKNGSSIFNNTGLIISIIILLLLLMFSYNKCYNNTEMFYNNNNSASSINENKSLAEKTAYFAKRSITDILSEPKNTIPLTVYNIVYNAIINVLTKNNTIEHSTTHINLYTELATRFAYNAQVSAETQINSNSDINTLPDLVYGVVYQAILTALSTDTFANVIDNFNTTSITSSITSKSSNTPTLDPPSNVRVNITKNNISISFTVNILNNTYIPKQFMVVLSQYNSEFINTGHNQLYLSNENEINTNAYLNNTQKQNTNLCTLINGMPSCNYTFNNVDITDSDNNIYYYKIGISSIYDTGNSVFITPYNITTINKLFNLTTTIDYQNNLMTDFNTYKATQAKNAISNGILNNANYSDTLSTAEGQYEIIKTQLGNYPSNLLMDPQSKTQNLLSNIVDKSMAQGILNINVK